MLSRSLWAFMPLVAVTHSGPYLTPGVIQLGVAAIAGLFVFAGAFVQSRRQTARWDTDGKLADYAADRLEVLDAQVAALQAAVERLKSDMDDERDEYRSNLEAKDVQIGRLQAEVDELNAEVAELTRRLDSRQ